MPARPRQNLPGMFSKEAYAVGPDAPFEYPDDQL